MINTEGSNSYPHGVFTVAALNSGRNKAKKDSKRLDQSERHPIPSKVLKYDQSPPPSKNAP